MPHARPAVAPLAAAAFVLVALLAGLLAGCSQQSQGSDADPDQVDATDPPELGACRVLTPEDVAEPSNATRTVPCGERHTAETFAVGRFPRGVAADDIDDRALGAYVAEECEGRFRSFVGGDESLVMRTTMTWSWFRPTQEAWEAGARWWRCDVVGGGGESTELVRLPTTAKGVLLGDPDDRWLVCVDGETVADSVKIPCSEPHSWRAVTTIVLGEPDEPYPGDRAVEVRTRDFCSDSVGAWLDYPVDYDYGYTWFHRAEWQAGNRRSICWAKTER